MLRTHLTRLNGFLVKSLILMPQESVCESGDKRYHGWHARWNNWWMKRTTFINWVWGLTMNFTGALTSVYVLLWKGKQRYFNEQLQETKAGDSCCTWKNLKLLLRNGSESSGAAARTANAAKTSVTTSFNRFFAIYLLFGISKVGPSIKPAIIFKWLPRFERQKNLNYERSLYRRFVRSLKNLNETRQKVLTVFHLVYLKTEQTLASPLSVIFYLI